MRSTVAAPFTRNMNNRIASLARRHAAAASAASAISPTTNLTTGVSSATTTARPQHLRFGPVPIGATADGANPRRCRRRLSSAVRPSGDGLNGIVNGEGSSSWSRSRRVPPPPPPSSSGDAPDPPRVTDAPPAAAAATTAQVYESRHSRAEIGFHVHDGPVPINQTARAAKARRLKNAKDEESGEQEGGGGNNLMDPFYVPAQEGQTHLMQGGAPCDVPPASAPPYRLADYGEESVHTLVLLRHGESEWNAKNRYTGWCDVELTETGEGEARAAGRLLAENGIEVDHAFTSVLRRAGTTCNMCLTTAGQHWVPVTKTWRLNERHYGALQGYDKDAAYEQLGIDRELVMEMRRSYATPPPRMEDDHPHWHGSDRRYDRLTPDQLEASRAESLQGAAERIMPFFNSVVVPSLREGNRCLVVSHANTIRTLIKQIDNISDEDIKQLSIPTGIPLIYRLDKNMRPVDPSCELEFRYMVQPKGYTWATSRRHGFHGVYLGDLERLQDIQRKRDATSRCWQRVILRNIASRVNEADMVEDHNCFHNPHFHGEDIVETKHLWWEITRKMQNPEFANMLLLVRMKEFLESLLAYRRCRKAKTYRYIPLATYEKMVEQIHLDSAGEVVDPFVSLEGRLDRECRQRRWIESLSADKDDSHSLIN